MSVPALPPEPALREIVRTLAWAGIPAAVGGSGLLCALGLAGAAHDWDLTCDADPAELMDLFAKRGPRLHGPGGGHADHKLEFPGEPVELIVRFACFVDGVPVHLPSRVAFRWRELPMAAPETWAVGYALLARGEGGAGREAKSERLFDWLARQGAHAARTAELLSRPIPRDLADRLSALVR